jgi:hypothetical protein
MGNCCNKESSINDEEIFSLFWNEMKIANKNHLDLEQFISSSLKNGKLIDEDFNNL